MNNRFGNNKINNNGYGNNNMINNNMINNNNNRFGNNNQSNVYVEEEVSEYNDEEDDENDEEEEINYDPNVFTDSNPEFVKFKNSVKEWVALDDDIKILQSEMAKRKKRKNEMTPMILDFMQRFQVNDLNTQNGQLRYTTTLATKPVNKQFLLNKLGDFFNDATKGEKITTYLFENREKTEKVNLRRVVQRKKLDIK